MNKNLFFFIFASTLLILSIVAICHAPIINNGKNYFIGWNIENCKKMDDEYQYKKFRGDYDYDTIEAFLQEKITKRRIKECNNHKTIYGLEYSAFIIDIVLGFICAFLGLINFLEPGKPFEKKIGFIGLITGIITTVITIVYVAFSANIFNNEAFKDLDILYDNKAYLHWNGEKYIYNYDKTKADEEDPDIKYVKYKDLGKIQYNYDSEFYQISIGDSTTNEYEYHNCIIENYNNDLNPPAPIEVPNTHIPYKNDPSKLCDYIWHSNPKNDSVEMKYIYDRWLTTIILGVIIGICGIALSIFGFLLF